MKNNKLLIYQITFLILILDQVIKIVIGHSMKLDQEIKIIPHFFSLLYLKNTGAAFSILEDSTVLLIIISVVFIVVLNNYIKKEESFTLLSSISLGLVMGGIFGNLIDRIIHHGVIDYLSFRFGNYSFPVFNLADIGITVGAFLFICSVFFSKKYREVV